MLPSDDLFPLVIGYGEIGQPLFEIVRGTYPRANWLDVEEREISGKVDVLHLAFPETDQQSFIRSVAGYIDRFAPRLAIIESTVSPGTTGRVYDSIGKSVPLCHSPVRGNTKEGIKKGILQYTKFIGGVDRDAGLRAERYYHSLGLRTHLCSGPLETELGKIFETTYRGIMMAWFQEIHRICRQQGAVYEEVVEFVGSTEREGKQPRPVFHPGVIGGHCIVQNAEKLLRVYPSAFAKALVESNKLRQEELLAESQSETSQGRRVTRTCA